MFSNKMSKAEGFWKWFKDNERELFDFDENSDELFKSILKNLKKYNSYITFEVGPVMSNGKREFVLSAGGLLSVFPDVEKLYNAAPELSKWEIIKFRPRREDIGSIQIADIEVKAESVFFKLYRDTELKLGITLFFEKYNEDEHEIYGQLGFLFLDEALGEYDVETKVGFIDFASQGSKEFDGALPITNLAEHFDDYFTSLSN